MSKFVEVTLLDGDGREQKGLINISYINEITMYGNNVKIYFNLNLKSYIISIKDSLDELLDKIEFSEGYNIKDNKIIRLSLRGGTNNDKILLNTSNIVYINGDNNDSYSKIIMFNSNFVFTKETYEEIVDIIKNLKDTPR